MAQVHYYRDVDGTLVDMSAYLPRLQWVAQSKAEEGAVGSWTVTLDDPNGEVEVLGHREWFVEDDESEDEDDIIFGGFIGSQTYGRMDGDQRRHVGPEARVITIELYDADTWMSRPLMRGSDSNRPRETDVERMQWLLGTAEAGLLGDTSTFVDTSGPRAMDKADLRGVYLAQVIGDCASASGKNYYTWFRKVAGVRTLFIWYGRDTLPDYASPFYITNDLSVLHGDGVDPAVVEDVWELSRDAKMVRSPERQYCGNYIRYGDKGAATFRHNAATHTLIAGAGTGHRVMTSDLPLVKTKAKAQARGDRQLEDVSEQDIRITTRLVDVPSTRVTLAKAGMLIPGIKGTHWGPTCDDWHEARIVSAQPKPHGKGELYDIDLELVLGGAAEGPPAPPFTGNAFAGLQRSGTNNGTYGTLEFGHNYDTNTAGGWDTQATEGPLHIDQADPGNYCSITVEQSMVARIYARAFVAGVAIPAVDRSMYVKVNGVVVGTATHHLSGGLAVYYLIDLRNFALEAGDVVSIDSEGAVFWTNSGTNGTQLIVGRGTYTTVSLAGTGTHFVGP